MVAPKRRLPEARHLIDQELYFAVHAPRQVGKTTTFRSLARWLNENGTFVPLLCSCETAQVAGTNADSWIA